MNLIVLDVVVAGIRISPILVPTILWLLWLGDDRQHLPNAVQSRLHLDAAHCAR